jgi:hypothetical protein
VTDGWFGLRLSRLSRAQVRSGVEACSMTASFSSSGHPEAIRDPRPLSSLKDNGFFRGWEQQCSRKVVALCKGVSINPELLHFVRGYGQDSKKHDFRRSMTSFSSYYHEHRHIYAVHCPYSAARFPLARPKWFPRSPPLTFLSSTGVGECDKTWRAAYRMPRCQDESILGFVPILVSASPDVCEPLIVRLCAVLRFNR